MSLKGLEQYLQLESEVKSFQGQSLGAESGAKVKELELRAGKLFPPETNADWKENIEVFFVAIVIALALRTFFLQPFVIPTDSMKPTLYGIPVEQSEAVPPGFLKRTTDFVLFGITYVYVHVDRGGEIMEVSETGPFGIDFLGYIPFIDRTRLVIGDQTYILNGTPAEFSRGTRLSKGMIIPDDSTPVNYVFGAGDHVFVNKFIYNFRKPHRGDVFVFNTEEIYRIKESLKSQGLKSQFYIKRCVGLPEDVLQIKPPYLISNGKPLATSPIFQRIYSMKDGYQGYSTDLPDAMFLRTSNDTYRIPKNSYWAMGDNSFHSSDSRFWGPVPAQNLVGTGLLIYWPFSSRWGLIP